MPTMSTSSAVAPPPDRGAGLRSLVRLIFGVTILGIAASVWLSVLDAQSQGLDLLVVTFTLFPVIGYVRTTRSAG